MFGVCLSVPFLDDGDTTVNFLVTLIVAGTVHALVQRRQMLAAWSLHLAAIGGLCGVMIARLRAAEGVTGGPVIDVPALAAAPSIIATFGSGLKAGLLTFGGAYTAIPFIQRDAVEIGRWLTNAQ